MEVVSAVLGSRPRRVAEDLLRQPPWLWALVVAVALGIVTLVVDPASGDLAAASYRSYLFAHAGLTVWDNGWYGGHYLPSYSLLSPELGAWFGSRLVVVMAGTVAAVLFAILIDGHFPAGATRLASAWFALGVGIELASERVPFDIGLALGLGALLAAVRGRRATALALGALSSLGSPVAGAFLGLVCVTWAIADLGRRRDRWRDRSGGATIAVASARRRAAPGWLFALTLAGSALSMIALLAIAFPEAGTQSYAASSFWPEETLVLAIAALLPRGDRTLRLGTLLYAGALLAAYAIPSAIGDNAERLGALVAAPTAAGALLTRRPRVLLLLTPALLFWQVIRTAEDLAVATSNPSVQQAYYAPLLDRLRVIGARDASRPTRIEVVPTLVHWDARWVASDVAIARGWERQVDVRNNSLFYGTGLNARSYDAWLRSDAISYVALPDAPLDFSGVREAALLRTGPPPYLRQVWHSAHWRLFKVLDAQPLVERPAVVTGMTTDSFTLDTPRSGTFTVRVRFTRYWALESGVGCVEQSASGWTQVRAGAAGSLHVGIVFSIARIFDDGPRCRT